MKKLDYTGPETISDLHKNMAVHGTNPRAVIRDVFGMLNRVTNGQVDIENIVRQTIKNIGYDNAKTDMDYRTCKIEVNITKQSKRLLMILKNI